MNWSDRIAVDPAILVGKPAIRGTRISVQFVIELLAGSWSKDDILAEYECLTAEDIEAALAYTAEAIRDPQVYSILLKARGG